MNLSLKQVGEKYRLKINETGGYLRQMGPRKLSKDRAEYRLAVLMGEEPYDYTDDPTSPVVDESVDAAINAYVEKQEGYITSAQAKIETANAVIAEQNQIIAEQQAIIDNPESTEEEKAAAEAAIVAAEKKIATNEKTIATQEKNIATYQDNIKNADKKVTSVDITDVPEVLTLDNTGYKVNVTADFSANESTLIEANEKIEKQLTIANTSETPANVVLDLGNSEDVILRGEWNEVEVKSVGTNSLTIPTNSHVKKLTLKRGHVWVNNALISDAIEEVVIKGGSVDANPEINATSISQLYSKPSVVNINTNLTANKNITTGILTSGHYIYNNNAVVRTNGTGSGVSGYMIRGSKLCMDFQGTGEWRSASNPTIWLTDFDGKVRIYDGKYFNEANHAECIYAEKGFIEIYGGEFHNVDTGEKNFLLNCLDANYVSGKAGITVYGGKFYGFDPANNEVEGPNTNFVAEGYVSVYHEEEDYYEVVPVDAGE